MVVRMFPIFLTTIFYWTIYSQAAPSSCYSALAEHRVSQGMLPCPADGGAGLVATARQERGSRM